MNPHQTVITEVVNHSMCIGCGVCAAICPRGTLRMEMSDQGIYHPTDTNKECNQCGLCLKICPFANNALNEDNLAESFFCGIPQIRRSRIAGYCLQCYAGYSAVGNHRSKGASGGIATWTLETLIKEKLVDNVICVKPSSNTSKLFEFAVCTDTEQVRQCARSCYYPVEMSDAVKHILNQNGAYAVIGLPCVCKAIRLAQRHIPLLANRIRFVLGLVCGQTKSRYFVDALCHSKLSDFQSLHQIQFRVKTHGRIARDLGFSFDYFDSQKNLHKQILYWSDGIGTDWNDGMFTPNSCFFCDDIFAECADAAFMDAWHRDYESDPNGNSIILVRNPRLQRLIDKFRGTQLTISKIPISKTILSQMGVVVNKRTVLKHRIHRLAFQSPMHRLKRINLFRRTLHPGLSQIANTLHEISIQSNACWSGRPGDIRHLEEAMQSLRRKIRQYKKQLRHFRLFRWLCSQIACRM